MPSLTTKYEEINGVKKKVFMFRGDEAYASTVDLKITNSTPVTTAIQGFKINITGTIYRNVGDSTVDIYDGNEIIATVNILNSSHSFTINNIYLDYNVEHSIYAKFNGNDVCLSKKSKAIPLTVEMPSTHITNITFTNTTTQISVGTTFVAGVNVKKGSTNVGSDIPVSFYLDGEYKTTSNTNSSGNATATITLSNEGIHTITASIGGSSTLNPNTADYELSVGCDVVFEDLHTIIANTPYQGFRVKFYDWYGELIESCSSVIDGTSYTTTTGSVNVSKQWNYSDPYEVVVTCKGSTKSQEIRMFNPTDISISSEDKIITEGKLGKYTINVDGTGYMGNIPVYYTLETDGQPVWGVDYSTNNSPIVLGYTGAKYGANDMTVTVGSMSSTYTIYDVQQCYTPSKKYNFNYYTDGTVSTSASNIVFNANTNQCFRFIPSISFPRIKSLYDDGTGDGLTSYKTVLEFDVVYVDSDNEYKIGFSNGEYINVNLSSNDKVKVVAKSPPMGIKEMVLYVNGGEVSSRSISNYDGENRNWEIKSMTNNSTLKITNLIVA